MRKNHPLRTIARLGWQPTLLAFAAASEGFIDTLFIAHIGISAIQAVAIAGSILLIQLTIYEAFGSAARYFTSTAKNKKEAWKIIIQGAYLGCLVSLILGGVTIVLAKQLFTLYGVEATSDGVLYLQIVGGSCVLPALFGVVSHGLQGMAEQKTTTIAGLVIASTHLLLDYVLINLLHLELMGAALAAVLSSFCGTGLIVVMFLRQAGSDFQWKLDWQLQKKMLSKALPQMVGNLSNQIGLVYYYAILARTGPEALAAVRILNVVEKVVYATWMKGIIFTISPVIGPLMNQKGKVARYIRWVMGTIIIGTFVSWAIQLILAHFVVGLFTDDPTVLKLAVWLILLYAWVNGLWYVYACVEEVFGVHKQIQITASINSLSSVLLVIGCWLASPTLVGVTFAEVVQYLILGMVSVAFLCGYYKHAEITLFPIRASIQYGWSFLKNGKLPIITPKVYPYYTNNWGDEWEEFYYKKYIEEVAIPQNHSPSTLEEMAPAIEAFTAFGRLCLREAAQKKPGMEKSEMIPPDEKLLKRIDDALAMVATDENCQKFLEFLTDTRWKNRKSTAKKFSKVFVQHAKEISRYEQYMYQRFCASPAESYRY